MKHGIKLRKLQRTPSHRWALLRNLVSALLHHESIKTTLPKAKETARLAEKIITLGKRGTDPARRAATAFLMPNHHYSASSYTATEVPPPLPSSHASSSKSPENDPELFEPSTSLLPKLFETLSDRYADRPGGYTRIHRFGKRQGDNAPHAILELVDGPKDLKFEMIARAVGREQAQSGSGLREEGLSERTKRGMEKVLRYRDEEVRGVFEEKVKAWSDIQLAEGKAANGVRRKKLSIEERPKSEQSRFAKPFEGRRYMAGERLGGMAIAHTGLGLARGALGGRGRGKAALDRNPRFLDAASKHSQELSV